MAVRFGHGAVMKIGSDEHKQRFCNAFIASHCRFDPESLAWPDLDAAALERLRGIPFWQEVLYTERRAGAIVAAYAATIADPLVREAVMLQGFEEARHAELLRLMIRRYGVTAEERQPDLPSGDPLRAFADFGYGQCLVEHGRRMKDFDPELLQPHFLPRLAGIALAGLRTPAGAAREKRA